LFPKLQSNFRFSLLHIDYIQSYPICRSTRSSKVRDDFSAKLTRCPVKTPNPWISVKIVSGVERSAIPDTILTDIDTFRGRRPLIDLVRFLLTSSSFY
jgi:hypothetical protein